MLPGLKKFVLCLRKKSHREDRLRSRIRTEPQVVEGRCILMEGEGAIGIPSCTECWLSCQRECRRSSCNVRPLTIVLDMRSLWELCERASGLMVGGSEVRVERVQTCLCVVEPVVYRTTGMLTSC